MALRMFVIQYCTRINFKNVNFTVFMDNLQFINRNFIAN